MSCSDPDAMTILSNFAQENRVRWEKHGNQITGIIANGVASGEDEEVIIESILHTCHLSLEK